MIVIAVTLFLAGLVLGSTLCNLTCGPILLMRMVGRGKGWRDGIAMALIFTMPRVFVLTTFGAIVGYAGSYASRHIDADIIAYVHVVVYLIIAVVMIMNGIGLARGKRTNCRKGSKGWILSRFSDPGNSDERLHLFALGSLFSLVCIGEAWGFLGISLVEGAMQGASPAYGALTGASAMLAFSLGLTVPPVLLSAMASEAAHRIDLREIAKAGGWVLVVLGLLLIAFEVYSLYSLMT